MLNAGTFQSDRSQYPSPTCESKSTPIGIQHLEMIRDGARNTGSQSVEDARKATDDRSTLRYIFSLRESLGIAMIIHDLAITTVGNLSILDG